MREPRLACPASESTNPVLSLNKHDIKCQIAGHMRPAEGSPCCNDYTRCQIWRIYKDMERRHQGRRVLEQRVDKPADLGLERTRA